MAMPSKAGVGSQQPDAESSSVEQEDRRSHAVRVVREAVPVSTAAHHPGKAVLAQEVVSVARPRRVGSRVRIVFGLVIAVLLGVGALLGIFLHRPTVSATTPMTVRVTLMDYMVMPAQRHVPVGKPIAFVVTNRGPHTHELVLEEAKAVDKALRYHGKTYEAADIKAGTTRTVTWTIPQKGTYKLACHIDHHYQMGMKTFITAIDS